jgi:hypothetical protein
MGEYEVGSAGSGMAKWRALVNTVMNLQLRQKVENFEQLSYYQLLKENFVPWDQLL